MFEKNIIKISPHKKIFFPLSGIPYKWGESLLTWKPVISSFTSMGVLDLLFCVIPHYIQVRKAFPANLNSSVKWILTATLNISKEKHSRNVGHFYWRPAQFFPATQPEKELIDVHAQEWKDIICYLVVKMRKGENKKKRQHCLRKSLWFMHHFCSILILSLLSIPA